MYGALNLLFTTVDCETSDALIDWLVKVMLFDADRNDDVIDDANAANVELIDCEVLVIDVDADRNDAFMKNDRLLSDDVNDAERFEIPWMVSTKDWEKAL